MKNIIYSILACLPLFFVACDKSTEDISKVTNFASLELHGDKFIKLSVGETYIEPGYAASEGGEDITSKVVITGSVNSSISDYYSIAYSIANTDGFSSSSTRTVLVVDPNNFAGAYLGECEVGTRHYYDSPITIKDNKNGTFTINDIVGGLQFNGINAGFDPPYDLHLEADIKLEANNSITLVKMGTWYMTAPVAFLNGSYTPETGTIKLELTYSGNPLHVTLTK